MDAKASGSAAQTNVKTSGETVTVALKHPHGLILRLHKMVDALEMTPLGPKSVKQAQFTGDQVVLNGYSQPNSKVPPAATAGAFALTHGVSKDFWDAWAEQNRDHPFLTGDHPLLFATTKAKAGDEAAEKKDLRTGFEPLNPEKLPLASVKTYDGKPA